MFFAINNSKFSTILCTEGTFRDENFKIFTLNLPANFARYVILTLMLRLFFFMNNYFNLFLSYATERWEVKIVLYIGITPNN